MEQNQLQNYIGRDIKNIISQMEVVSRTSKEGNPYLAIQITFVNGFQKILFIQSAETFAWVNALEYLQTSNSINNF